MSFKEGFLKATEVKEESTKGFVDTTHAKMTVIVPSQVWITLQLVTSSTLL